MEETMFIPSGGKTEMDAQDTRLPAPTSGTETFV